MDTGAYSGATMLQPLDDDYRMLAVPPLGAGARRYPHARFDAPTLVEAKGNRHISVCIPARNEAATVGTIVAAIVNALTAVPGGVPLVDEVLVVDDGSTDRTRDMAQDAGAWVIPAEPGSAGPTAGSKGQAMQTALEMAHGDLIVFVDADVTNFGPHFVTGLLGPLLLDDSTTLVKGYYERPLHGAPQGGGRVTELVAKPVIELLFPDLTGIIQPLAGETAAPRSVLEKCGLADGYQVELALLIDVAVNFGAETIAQVDLGVRVHRNRPLSELRPQATDILRTALARADGNHSH
jgi:glucosyl-3-phosphoglycerate synthase